jgi:hypothetical protein
VASQGRKTLASDSGIGCSANWPRDCQSVLHDHSLRRNLAESAAFLSTGKRPDHFTEIEVDLVALHRVARVAEGLEVREIILTAPVPWKNMINLKSFLVGRSAT